MKPAQTTTDVRTAKIDELLAVLSGLHAQGVPAYDIEVTEIEDGLDHIFGSPSLWQLRFVHSRRAEDEVGQRSAKARGKSAADTLVT